MAEPSATTESGAMTTDQRSGRGRSRGGWRSRHGGGSRGRGGRGGHAPQAESNNNDHNMVDDGEPSPGPSQRGGGSRSQRGWSDGTGNGQLSAPSRGRRGGGGGGGEGGKRRWATNRGSGTHVSGTHRTFGGRLTGSNPGLSPHAPDFVPGQPLPMGEEVEAGRVPAGPPDAGSQTPPPPPPPDAEKSTAPDLPTRIHEDIENHVYECVICICEVTPASRVWNCSVCWTVAHMPCVKRWHASQTQKNRERQAQAEPLLEWRCPGCNTTTAEEPGEYRCWCGKDVHPRPVAGLPPHSCGQSCSKVRGTCPHPCVLRCHAGPCPPCHLTGPTQACFCGREAATKPCSETDYANGWSCGGPCGDVLACGEHPCPRPCHAGLCGGCDVVVGTTCYCGKTVRDLRCENRDEPLGSFYHGQAEHEEARRAGIGWFEGYFDCGRACGRGLDCGRHECARGCHPHDEQPGHCPLSPDVLLHCPCGKTELARLLDSPRRSCTEEVPHCAETCDKMLTCGHRCPAVCHTGPCPPCVRPADIACRCGRHFGREICKDVGPDTPVCERVCQAQMNCGRHQCSRRCCTGDRKAISRRRAKTTQQPDDIEAEHICLRACGKPLKCGSHACPQVCHRGPCLTCIRAVFEEIGCGCGRTVLYPPLPCGTKPPECRFECRRPTPCGHPVVEHNCHPDGVACPKCPFLTEKTCVCGKQKLKNQPCWFAEARCGLPCGKKLKCGTHSCTKPCHPPGRCEDTVAQGSSHCTQSCGRLRKSCGHPCTESCHAPYPCKEERPCSYKIIVTCDCQHLKQEVKCGVSSNNPEPRGGEPLECDDECLRLQRNQRLASALNIDPATHLDDHVPYSDESLAIFKDHTAFAQAQEREFRVFAGEAAEKRIRFKPMPPHHRQFLHLLAADFGFDSQSEDPEPHCHVVVYKTPRFVSAPRKTLAQCVKIRSSKAGLLAAAATSAPPVPAAAAKEPFNAILLTRPRFGLTIDDLDKELAADTAGYPLLTFDPHFLPSDEVVVKANSAPLANPAPTASAIETGLLEMRPRIARTAARLGLAKTVTLCHVDDALLRISRREVDEPAAGGWSAVVGRAAKKAAVDAGLDRGAESFGIARPFVELKKKKVAKPEEVEDDWMVAADKLED